MFFSICILVLSLSLDALGVGIAYGLRKIKIKLLSTVIICMFSIIYSGAAIYLGKYMSSIITQSMSKLIGVLILIFMGCYIILQGLLKNKDEDISEFCTDINAGKVAISDSNITEETLLRIAIKSLGITIQVLRNPSECDIDKSGTIDAKESFLLGFALSVDAIGVGVGSALSGYHSIFIPFAIGLFQMVLLCIGTYLGKRISFMRKINEKILSIIPGILLIILALIRIY